jgi:CRP-like cAMP-binding protein
MIAIDLFRNEDRYDDFRQGQTIFREGDRGEKMYVVMEGSVMLSVKKHVVEELGPGGVLGEMSLIDTAPRSATAVAKTDCRLVPIDQKRFTFLVQQTPHFSLQIMRVIADRLRRMDQRL